MPKDKKDKLQSQLTTIQTQLSSHSQSLTQYSQHYNTLSYQFQDYQDIIAKLLKDMRKMDENLNKRIGLLEEELNEEKERIRFLEEKLEKDMKKRKDLEFRDKKRVVGSCEDKEKGKDGNEPSESLSNYQEQNDDTIDSTSFDGDNNNDFNKYKTSIREQIQCIHITKENDYTSRKMSLDYNLDNNTKISITDTTNDVIPITNKDINYSNNYQIITVSLSSYYIHPKSFHSTLCIHKTLYFIPFNANIIGIYHTYTHKFTPIPIDNPHSEIYMGSVLYKSTIYMCPYNTNTVGLFHIPSQKYRTLPLSIYPKDFHGFLKFESKVYFTPYQSRDIGIYDLILEEYTSVNTDLETELCKFTSSVVYKRRIYFCPYLVSVMGVFDIDTSVFWTISICPTLEGVRFRDSTCVKDKIYMVPDNDTVIGVFHIKDDHVDRIKLNYKLDYRNVICVENALYGCLEKNLGISVYHLEKQELDVVKIVKSDDRDNSTCDYSHCVDVRGDVYLVPLDGGNVGQVIRNKI